MTITDTDRRAVKGVVEAIRSLNDAVDFLSAQGIKMPQLRMIESFGSLNDRFAISEPFIREEIIS